jgi:hypothetical protein
MDLISHRARTQRHATVSSVLAGLDDEAVADRIQRASTKSNGFGGTTARMWVGETPVFCKLIPLTALELESRHFKSTANIFQLPTYYQFGIGSVGFGAWRELAAHSMASEWVATGKHVQFPLLHHWRIVKVPGFVFPELEAFQYLNHPAARGVDESSILERLRALSASTTQLAVFSESFDQTLAAWLLEKLSGNPSAAGTAVSFVESKALEAFEFMRSERFLHLDAHLENILTDGVRLYFADFGLALHESFDLTEHERKFLKRHAAYDPARFASSLVHTICRAMPGSKGWQEKLADPDLQAKSLPAAAIAALNRHAAIAEHMRQLASALVNTNRHATFSPSDAWLRDHGNGRS